MAQEGELGHTKLAFCCNDNAMCRETSKNGSQVFLVFRWSGASDKQMSAGEMSAGDVGITLTSAPVSTRKQTPQLRSVMNTEG